MFPFPPARRGNLYRRAFDGLVLPVLTEFAPDWLLISAGYDAHADDPLASLRLLPSDYASMAADLAGGAPPGRTIYFLEGGYDLDAIRTSVAATLAGAAGSRGSPGDPALPITAGGSPYPRPGYKGGAEGMASPVTTRLPGTAHRPPATDQP